MDTRIGHYGEETDELGEIKRTLSHIQTEQQKILCNQGKLYRALLILSPYIMFQFTTKAKDTEKIENLGIEK